MSQPLEVWGGVECSIVRTRGTTRNQLRETGHCERPQDLDLLAELGISRVRYPVLWETVEAERGVHDWSWADVRLKRLRELGIGVIAGLVHHGSGPAWTHLLDRDFPDLLAEYAARVARRYPEVEFFTPVNEPLTTARISGLYGSWHPFGQDESTCFRLTVAECRAITQSMRRIREVTPAARLVQTEDFGRIFSTPRLAYQADYENERRWLSLDLLTGRVGPHHPFFERLLASGVDRRHLDELAGEPCPPDLVGIDYYLTSDRFLDERVALHTGESVGGNGNDRYVDIAAVRSEAPEQEIGLQPRLDELWRRYRLPIVVTELHNGCTRDEQVRWLMEGWNGALAAARAGADIRAVTSWSLFGAVDWNSMLTRSEGFYESGAFDARFPEPRRTIVGTAVRSLARTGSFDHPLLDRPGWWRKERTLPEKLRPILLSGFDHPTSVLDECCNRRRLSSVPEASEEGRLAARQCGWMALRAGRSRSPRDELRFQADYSDGGCLVVTGAASLDWYHLANAFLDLAIDGHEGRISLKRADACNQYAFEAVDARPGRKLRAS